MVLSVRKQFALFMVVAFTFTFVSLVSAQSYITWRQCRNQPADWYGSDEAVRIAEQVLLYQRAIGGWGKNIDMAKPLSGSEREALRKEKSDRSSATIDNGATYTPMRFLAKVYRETKQEKYKDVFLSGLDFLLDIQYDNGGWPQFPYKKGYYQHITFNDNAMINTMRLLREIADGESDFSFVDSARRERCRSANKKGVDCILRCQIVVDGKKTAWCAQHDEKTLKPAPARTYEKISISGSESVGVVEFLMGIDHPSKKVIDAVQSAVRWFEAATIHSLREEWIQAPDLPRGRDKIVVKDENAPRLWARFYEIGTNRPIYCGRDGIIKYNLSEIEHERRVGYGWHTKSPASLIDDEYPKWKKRWALNGSDK